MSKETSILLYLFYGMVCYVLAGRVEKSRKYSLYYAMFVGIVLSILPALRATSVGLDTALYMPKFTAILNGGDARRLYGWDKGFILVVKCMFAVFPSEQMLLAIAAFVTNLLIAYRFYELRRYVSFKISILLYYALLYFYTYNIFKQFVAVAIIFYATRYIEKKKYIYFTVLTILAIVIHQSALLGFAFIAFNVLTWKHISRKRYVACLAFLAVIPLAVVGALEVASARIEYYFRTVYVDIGAMIFVKIFILLISMKWKIRISTRLDRRSVQSIQLPEEGLVSLRALRMVYCAGLMCTFIGYIFPYMDRIGLYFMMYECVYWGAMYKREPRNGVVWMFILMALAILVIDLLASGQGQVPYAFFW